MREVRVMPEGRRKSVRIVEKVSISSIGDLMRGQLEGVDPDAVDRAFIILTDLRSHQKPAGGNERKVWFGNRLRECGIGKRGHWQLESA